MGDTGGRDLKGEAGTEVGAGGHLEPGAGLEAALGTGLGKLQALTPGSPSTR